MTVRLRRSSLAATRAALGPMALGLAVVLAGCAGAPAPANPAAPAPAPAPEPTAPPPPVSMVSVRSVVGSYRVQTDIDNPSSRRRSRGTASVWLTGTPTAAPTPGAPAASFTASVAMPGYSRAPRGRSTQAAAWWPVAGDSVVVQFTGQQESLIQLRGVVEGRVLRGEIWFTSGSTGSSFQLGTFTSTRR